jgi:ABC-type antimicrobial peptide transport system permease subunit
MNDYIRKLAIDNVKKNKQFYKYIFLSIFFTFFIIIVVSNLSSSLEEISYEQKAYYYGKWDTIIITNDEEVVNAATKIADKVGKQYYGGSVIYNNENIGNIGYYDSEGYDLANLHLIEGALPSKEDDIVLEKSMSQKLNTKLNNQINIHYTYNNKEYNHTYNVVGIIEDYSNQWCSRGLSAITYTMDTQEYDLMLKGSSAINLWNSLIQMNDDAMVITDSGYDENGDEYTIYKSSLNYEQNNNVYNYPNIIFTNEGTYVLTDTPLTTTVLEIVVISLISIITTMMSSLNKRESQLSLLRSLGMTFKQIKRLLIYEGLYIAFIKMVLRTIRAVIAQVHQRRELAVASGVRE